MKHFRIGLFVGDTSFEYRCTTMHEAYEAISDITVKFNDRYAPGMDEVMETLVEMKNGRTLTVENRLYGIAYVDGEV